MTILTRDTTYHSINQILSLFCTFRTNHIPAVKVFASWCKTCQVFDLRYRKLANQYRETTRGGITNYGHVRFAEMQYDNPNNEEMCQLLNATKLPYILIYKGSSGKVDEFQCGPGNFQLLIDKVREYADSEEEIAADFKMDRQINASQSELLLEQTTMRGLEQQSAQSATPSIPKKQQIPQVVSSTLSEDLNLVEQNSNNIESLREQLFTANKEKDELFEVMKADLDWHQDQIRKLNESLNARQDQYEGLLRSRDEKLTNIEKEMGEKQNQFDVEVSRLKRKLDELSNTTQQSKQRIQSLEAEVHYWQQQAEVAVHSEGQTKHLNEKVAIYETERKSLRKLSFLALKRVWRGAGSILSKLRRK